MISEKEFANKHHISKTNLKKMLPYIEGTQKCPLCHKYLVPENAMVLYVPDKRRYGIYCKKYCYILDAVESGTIICEGLTDISDNECKSMVRELYEKGLIIKKDHVNKNSFDYKDYTISLKCVDWQNQISKGKTKVVMEALKTIQDASKAVSGVAELLKPNMTV